MNALEAAGKNLPHDTNGWNAKGPGWSWRCKSPSPSPQHQT
ncbi:hypothetical protein FOXG_19168 [Fusarium oxysporum f. sp. lycopersici 4287]|nr:hypothetical protein FOXG_19168 [Fusarium oxysporum f. sp. lycopersici 4287]EXK33187.1 hypothetical protein FOMG_11942 [Fusarium oxysporum f. sp. melonis 26406]KNB03608.1 hypothetical protein FOXG_19168 [Fusarium oxysporum f. sp. lycopersici 4287]